MIPGLNKVVARLISQKCLFPYHYDRGIYSCVCLLCVNRLFVMAFHISQQLWPLTQCRIFLQLVQSQAPFDCILWCYFVVEPVQLFPTAFTFYAIVTIWLCSQVSLSLWLKRGHMMRTMSDSHHIFYIWCCCWEVKWIVTVLIQSRFWIWSWEWEKKRWRSRARMFNPWARTGHWAWNIQPS